MGAHSQIMRPSDLRKAVSEWAAQGFLVSILPDGTITITPPPQQPTGDAFDMVDMRK
jgi:hypothetical protein